jgi:4Fe-4S ferredoxin
MAYSVKTQTECRFPPGVLEPVIDPERCEGKGPCVPACPYDVLIMDLVSKEQRQSLSLKGRVKLFVHGGKQAFANNADACRGCGLCVQVCPEKAIQLRKRPVAR